MDMEKDARVEEEMVVALLITDDDVCMEGEGMGVVVAMFVLGASRRRWPSLMVEHSERERGGRQAHSQNNNQTNKEWGTRTRMISIRESSKSKNYLLH